MRPCWEYFIILKFLQGGSFFSAFYKVLSIFFHYIHSGIVHNL